MRKINTHRNITLFLIVLILLITSFILYGRNKNKVFKDEYMKNIFIEEDNNEKESSDLLKENNINEKVTIVENKDVNKKEIVVEIKGEVVKPDVYTLDDGSIIKDLIDKAGGLTNEADINNINRADKLKSHQLIYIPNKEEAKNIINPIGKESNNKQVDNTLININTATVEELKNINGVGDSKAQNIIKYREENGGFKSIEDIKNVDGIGDKTFENIKGQITY